MEYGRWTHTCSQYCSGATHAHTAPGVTSRGAMTSDLLLTPPVTLTDHQPAAPRRCRSRTSLRH